MIINRTQILVLSTKDSYLHLIAMFDDDVLFHNRRTIDTSTRKLKENKDIFSAT